MSVRVKNDYGTEAGGAGRLSIGNGSLSNHNIFDRATRESCRAELEVGQDSDVHQLPDQIPERKSLLHAEFFFEQEVGREVHASSFSSLALACMQRATTA